MYYLLGESTIFTGLTNYFNEHQYQPVGEEDLFGALDAAAQADGVVLPDTFDKIMTPWTNQAGYPVVTVTRQATVDGKTTFDVTQVTPSSSTMYCIWHHIYSTCNYFLSFIATIEIMMNSDEEYI